ncbi:MAG: hypothetical protein JXJ17_16030 [Anaerolineae bacterium]|nr:hypothetical protein [Anaerolineae bacterium]
MKYVIPAAIAIGVGLVVLASYLIPSPLLMSVRLVFTDWAIVLAGLAVLIGFLNLVLVHGRRIQSGDRRWVYSLVTILAALFTLLVGVTEGGVEMTPALYSADSISSMLFQGVIVSSLATLSSLVLFFMVIAAVKMLKTKPDVWSILFLAVVIITLVGWIPLAMMAPANQLRRWLINVPAAAGARGILLGVALGTVVIGIRVLTGVERPYKD